MADQASVSRAASLAAGAAPEGVVESISEFASDVTTLVDLQTRLAVYDAKDALGRATWPAILIASGVAVALASLFVVLLGVSDLIALAAHLHAGAARLIVGLVALAVAGIIGYLAFKALMRSLESFRRSREELSRNISWLKTVVVHSGRPGARRRV